MNYSCQAFLCNILFLKHFTELYCRSPPNSGIERLHHHHLRSLRNLPAKHWNCPQVQRGGLRPGHHLRPAHPGLPGQPAEAGGGPGEAQHHSARLHHSIRSRQLYSSVLHLKSNIINFSYVVLYFSLPGNIYFIHCFSDQTIYIFLTRCNQYFWKGIIRP